MLCDQCGYPRPRREREQALDKASADESAGTVALAPRPAQGVKLGDQGSLLRENRGERATSLTAARRATLPDAIGATSRWSRPRKLHFAGALLTGFAGTILLGASDGKAPGGPRARAAAAVPLTRIEVLIASPVVGSRASACVIKRLLFDTPGGEFGWGRRGLNPQGDFSPPASKAGAFANFATPPPELSVRASGVGSALDQPIQWRFITLPTRASCLWKSRFPTGFPCGLQQVRGRRELLTRTLHRKMCAYTSQIARITASSSRTPLRGRASVESQNGPFRQTLLGRAFPKRFLAGAGRVRRSRGGPSGGGYGSRATMIPSPPAVTLRSPSAATGIVSASAASRSEAR